MTMAKIYDHISAQLLEANLTHPQRMQVRRIIANVLLEAIDDDMDKSIESAIKIKSELKFSLN